MSFDLYVLSAEVPTDDPGQLIVLLEDQAHMDGELVPELHEIVDALKAEWPTLEEDIERSPWATHPLEVLSLEEHSDRAQVQPAPATASFAMVVASRPATAPPAPSSPARPGTHVGDDDPGPVVQLDMFEHRAVVQPQQTSPYPEHAPPPST